MTRLPATVTAYVALGANLGDAVAALRDAALALAVLPHTQLRQCSSLYRTAPQDTDAHGQPVTAPGPDYLNAVVALDTNLSALDLLDALQHIEQQAGRERPYRNAPRTLDLDLLLYGDERMDTARLTVPHPRMAQRAFVMLPLAEVAPDLVTAAQRTAVNGQPITRLGPLMPSR